MAMQTDPNGIPYGEAEMALLRLHANLIDFYTKHNPENVNEEVLTILMQFFIDAGGVALNKKLMAKYGEDLQTFKRSEKPVPSTFDLNDSLRRTSLKKGLQDELGIELPPAQKVETATNKEIRKSLDKKLSSTDVSPEKKHKKKKNIEDPELKKFKAEKEKEIEVPGLMDDLPTNLPQQGMEDQTKKLFLLDTPKSAPLSSRDLIEAFYAKYDEGKLDADKSIERFVTYVAEHSLKDLSDRLKSKYGEGLEDQPIQKAARRRKNLEDLLTAYYLKHDKSKLETRWTVLKILSWTLENGVPALNKKFSQRYGFPVVTLNPEEQLDI